MPVQGIHTELITGRTGSDAQVVFCEHCKVCNAACSSLAFSTLGGHVDIWCYALRN